MAIRTEKSLVYHVPKSGGIYVKEAMRRSGLRYGRCKDIHSAFWLKREHSTYRSVIDEHKDGLFSFCFVRHPVDWYRSFWSYRMMSRTLDLRSPPDWCWSPDFNEFVNNVLDTFPRGWVNNLYQCYVGKNADKVDFIGRQENLTDDLVKALNLAGEEFNEEKLRTTRRWNAAASKPKIGRHAIMDEATQARVIEAEDWVMETFYNG